MKCSKQSRPFCNTISHPFWEKLLLADIFHSIMPNILHQLLQGVMKHIIGWSIKIFGPMEINCTVLHYTPKSQHNVFLQRAYHRFLDSQVMSTRRCVPYFSGSLLVSWFLVVRTHHTLSKLSMRCLIFFILSN